MTEDWEPDWTDREKEIILAWIMCDTELSFQEW